MKNPALMLVLLVGLVACMEAMAGDAETELVSLLDDFLQGASVNDAAVHDRFWAEELVYTSSAGMRFGKAEIMAGLAADSESEAAEPGPSYSARDVQVQIFGEIAVITFRLVAEHVEAPTEYFFNTGVFRVIDGRWQAVFWQATRAAP